jgi:hypothetical protein
VRKTMNNDQKVRLAHVFVVLSTTLRKLRLMTDANFGQYAPRYINHQTDRLEENNGN